ncbi:MAG: recombinase family protein [Clostridiales bacterium]|nr:recombinase family protein [Clostridiales bacterium]
MQPIKAVAYARYSSDKQQESSIVVQLAAIHRFCDMHDIELTHEYVDEAQTGTNANRKDFQQMVQDAPKKEFRFIIVHRMDRWARNVDDARHYKKYFSKYGIKIISALEEFDETPEGQFFELMSMGMAELYSKKLARESIAGLLANAREGKVHGSVPAIGYTTKNKRYVIHEEEAEAVKIMFEMVKQGYSYTQIRDYLNVNGYRRKDGRKYTIHIYDILRNRKYIGEYIFNQRCARDVDGKRNNRSQKPETEVIRISGAIPRIIDDETFFTVQAILDERSQRAFRTLVKNRVYLLSGLVKCNQCGKAMCGSLAISHKSRRTIYHCPTKQQICPTKTIRTEFLEDYVDKLFRDCLFQAKNEDSLCTLVKQLYLNAYDKMQAEKESFEKRIAETQKVITETTESMQGEVYKSLKVYSADIIASKERELKELEFKKKLLLEKIEQFPAFDRKLIKSKAKEYRGRLKNTGQELRAVWIELIRQIRIDNENIRVIVNLHKLLNSEQPITATILEKRDNIALQKCWKNLALTFPELTVEV